MALNKPSFNCPIILFTFLITSIILLATDTCTVISLDYSRKNLFVDGNICKEALHFQRYPIHQPLGILCGGTRNRGIGTRLHPSMQTGYFLVGDIFVDISHNDCSLFWCIDTGSLRYYRFVLLYCL